MGKKPKHADLLAVKVLQEQRWAFEGRLAHLSYHEMRLLSSKAPPVGLGYDVSEHRLKGLVASYRERMADIETEDLAEHRARELHDLDLAQRRVDAIAENAARRVAEAAEMHTLDVHGSKLVLDATAQRRAIGESRRKLLGLDQPVKAELEVTTRDAVTEELNAMLSRAGRPPIKVEQ